ncbi:MAG: LamG domain-containing protein [Polyangiales bacterium]
MTEVARGCVAFVALGAFVLLTACDSHQPTLAPSRVPVADVTTTDFVVGGLAPSDYLEAEGDDLHLRAGVEVWLGTQRATVTGVDAEGLHVQLSSPMPAAYYDLRVSGPKGHTVSDALEVFARSTGPDSGADAGQRDATVDADAHSTPFDAGSDAPFEDAPIAPVFCDPEDDELVACYEFESGGIDGSAAGNDLTLTEVSFAPGVSGESLVLDEPSAAVALAPMGLNFPHFTIELWVLPDAIPADGRRGLVDKNGQYGLFLQTDGSVRCTAGVGVAVSSRPLAAGEWTHIACTMDGREILLHRNGSEDDRAALSGETPSGSAALHIGEDSPGGGDQFVGRLDGVRIWSQPRTEPELCASAGPSCTP